MRKIEECEVVEQYKRIVDEIFLILERYHSNECSYDKAREDAGNIIRKSYQLHAVTGYMSGTKLQNVLFEIKRTAEKIEGGSSAYPRYTCKLEEEELEFIERVLAAFWQ
ncbi:MAG: hypothetical protein LBO09_02315 [Candidatus Peribacteria bacterium]|jgi:hypothetical protein|nr:hypothetical protein [Candidatus Peribacteria bacterium]